MRICFPRILHRENCELVDQKAARRDSERVQPWGTGRGAETLLKYVPRWRKQEDLTEQEGLGFSRNIQC